MTNTRTTAYERALAFLDEAVAVLDDCAILPAPQPTECDRPSRSSRSAPSRDREHDRGADRQGFRPW
jgi:hypothetical protein